MEKYSSSKLPTERHPEIDQSRNDFSNPQLGKLAPIGSFGKDKGLIGNSFSYKDSNQKLATLYTTTKMNPGIKGSVSQNELMLNNIYKRDRAHLERLNGQTLLG